MNNSSTRRGFLAQLGGVAAFTILPAGVRASSPNAKLQIAQIGVGGRGKGNFDSLFRLPNIDMVALCDVDSDQLAERSAEVPQAETFRDYRCGTCQHT